jgi:hypothetical protein
MATDSTLEDTDASPDEGPDETSGGTPSPPRPPRPGKRSKGSGRIPIPLPQSRTDLEAVDGDADHAPAVNIDERDEPAFPLVASRAKPPSVPEESFADVDADLADHAPNAPVTPWRGMPAVKADAAAATPPRGTPLRFRADDDELASQPEPTIVGKVPDNLLELSSGAGGGDENTRAFTAPRELIELAKRKREERLYGSSPPGAEAKSTARPQRSASDDVSDLRVPAAPNVPVDSLPPPEDIPDAAPPVAHSHASELDPESRPAHASRKIAPESGPEIEIDPASELSPSARRAVLASTGRNPPAADDTPGSEPVASTKKPSRNWLLLFGLFVAVGIIIARWRELAALFR